MPIFSADGFGFSKTRTGNSVCGKENICNIIKQQIYRNGTGNDKMKKWKHNEK